MSSQAPQPSQAAAAAAPLSARRVLPYLGLASLIALTQGLSQGFTSANLAQLAGDLGVSTVDASWLMAAYMAPRASLPLLLTKLRSQYGLLAFAKTALVLYAVVAIAACFATSFHTALTLQLLAGCVAAPLSTLAFLYMLEPLPQKLKLVFGLPMALAVILTGPNLARVISPLLIGDGGFLKVHLLGVGLSLLSLALALRLPLAQLPRVKVIETADLTTFALIAAAFGGITSASILGPVHWWTDMPWIGVVLALSILGLTLAVLCELGRKTPLVDFRWLASPAMLQMTGAMLIFRILLSEQSSAAPRMFQVLGFGPESLTILFTVIVIAGLLVPFACLVFLRPGREPHFHVIALVFIAIGAWIDSQSTVLTRPIDMALSQMLIAFSGMMFMAPAMMMGLLAALKRGPNYLMSFIVVFLSTQSLGGVIGSSLFTTITNHRQAFHYQTLTEQLRADQPMIQAEITRSTLATLSQTADSASARLQAVSALAQEASRQSWVMAYNDAYVLTAIGALAALAVLLLHMLFKYLENKTSPVANVDSQSSS